MASKNVSTAITSLDQAFPLHHDRAIQKIHRMLDLQTKLKWQLSAKDNIRDLRSVSCSNFQRKIGT